MAKKIKIFLGAFINYTNAQNLNCLSIAKHIDKNKFEVYSLELHSGNLDSQVGKIDGVKIFKCFRPYKISGYLGFLWGIWNCDVAYLPKHELWRFNRFSIKLFRKKSFSTVEGILDKDNLNSAIAVMNNYENVINSKKFFTKIYGITNFVSRYNSEKHLLNFDSKTLYLGCDTKMFYNLQKEIDSLQAIAFIGRLKRRKGIFDFLELAETFPKITFLIFGNGEDAEEVENYINKQNLKNVNLLGVVSHQELAIQLKKVQLHILPSRSEGFPKVILETAAAGVPSVVYSDYGASEWISTGENGWVVDTIEEIKLLLSNLQNDLENLNVVSKNSELLAEKFDWKTIIKDWENVIEKINLQKN